MILMNIFMIVMMMVMMIMLMMIVMMALVFSDHSVKILPAGDGRETMECLPSSPS